MATDPVTPDHHTDQAEVDPVTPDQEIEQEAEGLFAGPGFLASKSQAKGGIAGAALGAIAGALLGLLVGLVAFDSSELLIAVIAFTAAGATFGLLTGAYLRTTRTFDRSGVDR